MKKIFIVTLLLVSPGLTALSITRDDHSSKERSITSNKEKVEAIATTNLLGTAD